VGTNAFVQVADLEYRWLAINQAAANEFERISARDPEWSQHARPARVAARASGRLKRSSRALAGEEFTAIEEFGDPERDRRAYECVTTPCVIATATASVLISSSTM
jgi:hypothetical protein